MIDPGAGEQRGGAQKWEWMGADKRLGPTFAESQKWKWGVKTLRPPPRSEQGRLGLPHRLLPVLGRRDSGDQSVRCERLSRCELRERRSPLLTVPALDLGPGHRSVADR